MPSRLFWVLRPTARPASAARPSCFNAFAAFLGSATPDVGPVLVHFVMFQCLRGFSGFCDQHERREQNHDHVVSMPSRLFWVLRLALVGGHDSVVQLFQCLRGFSGFCDFRNPAYTRGVYRFQCLRGFSGFCDGARSRSRTAPEPFQCLRGFSGFCDEARPAARRQPRDVSMPSRLFWVLRPKPGCTHV